MISSIRLKNIRTYEDSLFEFKSGINLIIGQNGSGKTTILESIGFFAFGKYISVEKDFFAIRRGESAGRIEAVFDFDKGKSSGIGFSTTEKVVTIDDKRVPISDLIGFLPQIFFNPETVELVFESPNLRRRELDVVLTQLDHGFVVDILNYKKILKQRNALLRLAAINDSKRSELFFWDERLSLYAKKIYKKRVEILNEFNKEISALFRSLSKKEGDLALKYIPSTDYERFEEHLVSRVDGDLRGGSTSIGPHRDDFTFLFDRLSMREGASRGEQRLAAIAFKVISGNFLSQAGVDPIFILDDVFSELDVLRQEAVARSLDLFSAKQVFITATDKKVVPKVLLEAANIINI